MVLHPSFVLSGDLPQNVSSAALFTSLRRSHAFITTTTIIMRLFKCSLSPHKDKWNQAFNELQAMRILKKKISEEIDSPQTNFISILSNSFQAHDADPSPSAYSFIIKYLTHKHLFSHLHPILDHLERRETFQVPEKIFINLIRSYGKLGLYRDSVDIFYRIPKFRCAPSVFSLNSLLFILCKREEGLIWVRDVLMNTIKMGIRLEASTFRILIRALCRIGKVGSAVELLNVMMQLAECTPDPRMYSLVLKSLCKHGGGAIEVVDFLEVMRNAGFSPDISDYSHVIGALAREKKANEAYCVLAKMKSEGKRPDILSYNIVLNGFLAVNDFPKVDELFDEMLLMGLVPNVSTYNAYIDGLCRQGDFNRARWMIVSMEKVGCRPDATTFTVLVDGYAKAGEMEERRKVMNEMRQKGFHWNAHIYETLIDLLIRVGDIVEAHELLIEMMDKGFVPWASTLNSLCCNLCKNDHLYDALQLLDTMINQSMSPDATLWESLVIGHRSNQLEIPLDLDAIILGSSL